MTAAPEPQAQVPAPSLHGRILGELEERILSGEWPPGHRIPSEHDLADVYDCSRMTVNKVLTQLAQAGLIERRRKAGSFVRRPYSQSAVLEIKDVKAEVLEQGLAYGYEILSSRKRPIRAGDRSKLALAVAGPVLDVVVRHRAGRRPFCLEERLINLGAVPEAGSEHFAEVSPGAWLLTRVPWTAAEHRIRAEASDAETARLLGVAAATACLVIERRTSWAEQPITFVRLTYPGDAHELVARFVPSQG
ncbi:MAG TPA: histidine utilization repressor [Lichenihabitans sp.]|jgi:GntR family histidine utilization transcriptional repressor|nr:histidine utilization repressor [Lichenihabitans sp.]